MGTRWRGLLAPINKPTGDGRRMAHGAFTHRPLPLGLKWQRVDDAGHDASVVIGLMDRLTIDEEAGEVWGEGELFNDQPDLPRLTEDVGEALLLTTKKVIGPSVDAGAAEAVLVRTGSDVPLTGDEIDDIMWEAMESGTDPDIEILFTRYEIAAATLVVIPAFAEARPFELLAADADVAAEPVRPALVASLTAAASTPVIPANVFDMPAPSEYVDLTVEDRGEGFLRVFGYLAPFGTCHAEFRDVCRTPPTSTMDYAAFHRYPIDVVDAAGETVTVRAGRITTGFGEVGTGCACCRGKDDHACTGFSLAQAIGHHDQLTRLANVRVVETEVGPWLSGFAYAGDVTDRGLKVLSRRKVSGDWRDIGGELELVEVLALAVAQPGFPPPRAAFQNGRTVALVAARGTLPRPIATAVLAQRMVDTEAFAANVAGRVIETLRSTAGVLQAIGGDVAGPGVTAADLQEIRDRYTEPAALTAAEQVHTGAMVALVPAPGHAYRLAVQGGEPATELHMTYAYLGEGADIPAETRTAVIAAMAQYASTRNLITADGFAVSAFNPNSDQQETAIVLGVSGEAVTESHDEIVAALAEVFPGMPEQHSPFVAHVTLAYTDDLGMVQQLADRTGQDVVFDRIRCAFAGDVTDILLGAAPTYAGDGDPATAALFAEVDLAIANVDPDAQLRAVEAAALASELEDIDASLLRG